MVDLVPFRPEMAQTVSGWTRSPEEVRAWAARFDESVPPDVIVSWSAADDVDAFGLVDDENLVGYGELWTDDEEAEVELARLIIAPSRRGAGLGRLLVDRLTELGRTRYPDVLLRVRPDNTGARRCYAAAGYRRVSPETEAEWNEGQPTEYVWMVAPGHSIAAGIS